MPKLRYVSDCNNDRSPDQMIRALVLSMLFRAPPPPFAFGRVAMLNLTPLSAHDFKPARDSNNVVRFQISVMSMESFLATEIPPPSAIVRKTLFKTKLNKKSRETSPV
jgi:hypothetical protein